MESKISLRCKGLIPYHVKLEDESYSNPENMMPIESTLKETDCSSMNEPLSKMKYFSK